MNRERIFLIITATVVPVVLLVMLEIGLRLGGYGTRSDFFVPIEGQRAYTANSNFARQFFPPALARLPQPIRVAFDKPDDVTRIVVLGGSAAMGEPEPAFSFSRVLEVMLARIYPDRKFEVINTGMATINSHVVRLIAEECEKIQPDVALIYMGNNEVVGPFGAGTVFGSYSPSLTLIRAGILLRSLRLGQLIEQAARWIGGASQFVVEGEGMAMFRDQSVRPGDERLLSVYSHFEQNLDDIIETLKASGAHVVVSTVGANYVDHSPFASVFGQTGLSDPLTWGKLFAAGIGHFKSGEHVEAIQAFEMANRIDSTHAELHFRLGHLLLGTKDTVAARDHLIRARDFDALRFRVDSRLNDVIRYVSESRGVRLVDADRILCEAEPSGIGLSGNGLFHEHVHLNFEGNYTVAHAFVNELSTVFKAESPEPPETPAIDVCAEDLAFTPFDRYRLHASVSGLMGRAPFTNQFDYLQKRTRINAVSDSLQAQGTSSGGIGRSLTVYRHALARRPEDLVLKQNYARLLQETGALADATMRWKDLLNTIPDTPSWRLAIATALSDQGAHQAALFEYRSLEASMPGLVLPHIQMGFEFVSTGQIGEAIHVLAEALQINPGSTIARTNLAGLYEDVGESALADTTIERGLKLVRMRGDYHAEADLMMSKGDLLARRGSWNDAVEAFEKAKTLAELVNDVILEARIRLSIAKAYGGNGERETAAAALKEGRAFARAYLMTEAEAQYVVESALLEAGTGEMEAASTLIDEAIGMFESLSDRHPRIEELRRYKANLEVQNAK